jgi:hypothetical protein
MNALDFANWFAAQVFVSKMPLALREHNADAIMAAGHANFKALGIIEQAWSRHLQREQDDRDATAFIARSIQANGAAAVANITVTGTDTSLTVKSGRVPIPIPKTPKGAEKWPEYTPVAKAQIDKLTTLEEIDDWIEVNRPFYKNRVAEIAIDNRLRDRREAIQNAGGRIETHTMLLTRIRQEVTTLNSEQEIVEWSKGDIRQPMMDLSKADPDAFEQAKAIIDARRFEVETPA